MIKWVKWLSISVQDNFQLAEPSPSPLPLPLLGTCVILSHSSLITAQLDFKIKNLQACLAVLTSIQKNDGYMCVTFFPYNCFMHFNL